MTVTQHLDNRTATFSRLGEDSVLAGLFATSVPEMYWPPVNAAEAKTGAMVALLPSEADAARLAVPGGEPADQLHVTLLYLGKATDIPPEGQDAIENALRSAVEDASGEDFDLPLTAEGFALSIFNPPGHTSADGKARDACIALGLSGDDLEEIQAIVEDTVHELTHAVHGFEVPEQHAPWTPHITLVYTGDAERLAELTDRTGPIAFDRLRVAFAGRDCDIPLRPAAPMTIDDGHTSPVGPSAKYDPTQKRDNDGQWTSTGPGVVKDVLGLANRIELNEGETFIASDSGKIQKGADESGVPMALVNTPAGPRLRLGDEANSEASRWTAESDYEVRAELAPHQIQQMRDNLTMMLQEWDREEARAHELGKQVAVAQIMERERVNKRPSTPDELTETGYSTQYDISYDPPLTADEHRLDQAYGRYVEGYPATGQLTHGVGWALRGADVTEPGEDEQLFASVFFGAEPQTGDPQFGSRRDVRALQSRLDNMLKLATGLESGLSGPYAQASFLGRVLASRSRLAWAEAGCRPQRAKYDPTQKRDNDGQWTDGVPGSANLDDKLKLGKRAPAGYLVRSSKKIKTDYADVGIAEVDGPDGPHVRIGVIGGERGKWDAGFTGESRKAQLRQQIAEKRRVFDNDDDAPDDIEDQIGELESELEDLDSVRTAIVSPESIADLRRQLGEGLEIAKENKAKQDATMKAFDALDEKRDDLVAEFSDAELERKISKVSGYLRSKLKTIKGLENGPNPPNWSPELIAELTESHKADVPGLEAELAPLLARRAELVPPDALAKLEDLDRQYRALTDVDIDDMLTAAEATMPNGSRVVAEIWGSDDVDEQWVSTRLYVLAPGETTADADEGDDYGYFRGLRGLSKLITGLDVSSSGGVQNRLQAKYDPSQPRDPGGENGGQWTDGPGIDLPEGALKGFKVLSQNEYSEAYGPSVDEKSIDLGDGVSLTARYFESGDSHVVLDLPGDKSQVFEEMTPDAMRQLADDLEDVLDNEIDDEQDYLEGVVADADSHDHGFYVALHDNTDVHLQPTDNSGELGDHLELSEEDAGSFVDVLRTMADDYDGYDFDAQDDDSDSGADAEDAEAKELPTDFFDAEVGEVEVSFDTSDNTVAIDWPGNGFALPVETADAMVAAVRRLSHAKFDEDDPDTRVERVQLDDEWVVDLYGDGHYEIGPVDGDGNLDDTDLRLEDLDEASQFAGTLAGVLVDLRTQGWIS